MLTPKLFKFSQMFTSGRKLSSKLEKKKCRKGKRKERRKDCKNDGASKMMSHEKE